MSGPTKVVRFKLAWQTYRVGDEITPDGTLRDWLVGNGYVDIVDPKPAKLSKKAADKIAAAQSQLV